ncbi:hypothetical protein F5887DRAFT_1079477 [Amanita rubescens]|nr:hypothetical protein F5887DRAFT_1079477 [Amanita rubescens]
MSPEGNDVLCGLSSGQFERACWNAVIGLRRDQRYDFRSLVVMFRRNEVGIKDIYVTCSGSGLGVATSDGLPFVAAVTQVTQAVIAGASYCRQHNCVTNGEIWPFFIFNVAQSGEGGTLSISDQFHLKEDLSRLPLVIGLLSNWINNSRSRDQEFFTYFNFDSQA